MSLASCGTLFYSQSRVGEIELRGGAEQHIELRNLPDARELVVGLGVASCDLRSSERRVTILMKDEKGHVVISEEARLKDLLWMAEARECAPAFGYVRGKAREHVVNSKGDTCGEPIYTGADYGYGTYFKSRKDGVYDLLIRIDGAVRSDGLAEVRLLDDGPFAATACK